jgi:hypothetical protein
MCHTEDAQEQTAEEQEKAQLAAQDEAREDFAWLKSDAAERLSTRQCHELLGKIIDDPDGVLVWLNDQVDSALRRLQQAGDERRQDPREGTYNDEDRLSEELDVLTDVRIGWRNLLDLLAHCVEDETPLMVALDMIDR